MATENNGLDQLVIPVEEMNAEEVTETSSNLNISLTARERLMKKLQGISTMPQRKLRGLRDEPVLTRFDDQDTKREEDSLAVNQASNRWKKLGGRIKEYVKISQEEESFQFFAGTFPAEEDKPVVNEVSDTVEDDDQLEDSALLKQPSEGSEAFDINQHQVGLLLPPQTMTAQECQKETSDGIFHYVSPNLAVERKISSSMPIRFCEDEGFYAGGRPHVRYSSLSTMEGRYLLRPSQNNKWFGEDGRLLMESNPCFKPHSGTTITKDEPTACEVVFNNATCDYALENSTGGGCELGIDIISMKFSHHHLFTKEHGIVSRLQALCSEYLKREKEAITIHLEDKLFALKIEYNELKQRTESTGKSDELMYQYLRDIRHTRQLKNTEEAIDYRLVKTIFRTWRELKAIRETQGYTSVPGELIVHRQDVDAVDNEMQWQRAIEEEVQEAKEEFHYWKRNKKPDQSTSQLNDEDLHSEDSNITSGHSPDFNERAAREQITTYYKQNKWKPGESRLIPKLKYCIITTECSREEHHRLEELSKLKYKIRLLINDTVVSETKERMLEKTDFSVVYGEPFEIKLTYIPEIITLQVLESGVIKSTTISEVFLPVPGPSCTISNEKTEQFEFTSIISVPPVYNSIGSGGESGCLTSGTITCKIFWINYGSGNYSNSIGSIALPLINSIAAPEAQPILGEPGNADTDYLKVWLRESKLDPNDPRNAALLEVAKGVAEVDEEFFRLNELHSLLCFVSDGQFNGAKRYRTITKRQQEHHYFKNKSVPLYDEGVTREMWKAVNDEQPIPQDDFPSSDEGFREARKQRRIKTFAELEKRVSSQIRRLAQQPNLSDVVHFDLIPNISWIQHSITQFLSPRRPLKPIHQPKRNIISQNDHVEGATLYIRVVRAHNLPTRRSDFVRHSHPLSTSSSQLLDDNVEENVCPFIEVSLGDNMQKTSVATGPNPFWNEEISFSFNLSSPEYETDPLQKVASQLQFNFFDEIIVNVKRNSEVHHKIYKLWLGNLWMSVSTLYQSDKIEGTFKINVPPMILGYDTQSRYSDGSTPSVYLLLSLEPTLNEFPLLMKKLDSIEEPYLLQKAEEWQCSFKDKFPSRTLVTTGINSNGKTFFVTRTIHPQNPPDQLWNDQTNVIDNMKRLSRFVSLIPSLPNGSYFSDVWISSDQFLEILGGNQKEHAALLCNYFLFHQQEAWIVVGRGIPEGDTYYVLTHSHDGSTYWLWNATTGEHYDQLDTNCPLISVGSIFNARNVWANVQSYDKLTRMDFDVNNSGQWQALFTNKESTSLSTNQQANLHYNPTDPAILSKLQDRINFLLKKNFVQWRSRHVTRWNSHCSQILQRLLPKFEVQYSLSNNQTAELREFNAIYKMNGFPFNILFTSIADIITKVKNTEIYAIEDEDIEFALAVYIHNYPNDVISVWLYIATLKQL
ncbi:coiled-coil and C2 domain-containing protein 2A-like isoform X2 [Dysidea avara]|uniref:coiled-coil and C2 domain-containing protein 2A-like isoform X2 n=1 Tax=Dysidea avara TaxID=196820 RepID=UPI00332F1913